MDVAEAHLRYLKNSKPKQVNLKEQTIQLLPGTTKNDKGRTVRMTQDVYDRLPPCVKGKKPADAILTWKC
jgi:hypothetical protein